MDIALFGAKYNESLKSFRKDVEKICKRNGHKLDQSYFKTTSDEDREDPHGSLKLIEKVLNSSDAIIVEATEHSSGVGLISGLAIAMRKIPILILYKKDREGKTSANLASASKSKRNVFLVEYDDENLESHIIDFFKKSKHLIWHRFTVEFDEIHGRFLNKWADKYGKPKIEFFREMIDQSIREHKEKGEDLLSN